MRQRVGFFETSVNELYTRRQISLKNEAVGSYITLGATYELAYSSEYGGRGFFRNEKNSPTSLHGALTHIIPHNIL